MNVKWVLAIFGMVAVLGGCENKEEQTVYSGEDGKVTVTQAADGSAGTVKVEGEDGTVTWAAGQDVLAKELGVPLYPGATAGQGGTLRVENEQGADTDAVVSASLHSTDSIDKIAQYYKGALAKQMPRIFEMTMPTGKMVTLTVEKDGTVKTVVLSQNTEQGGTDIQLSRITE